MDITPVCPVTREKFPQHFEGYLKLFAVVWVCMYLLHDFSRNPKRRGAEPSLENTFLQVRFDHSIWYRGPPRHVQLEWVFKF